ncbi:MAG TPA: acyltransferase [Rhizomicrobium sp.]|nr:acyltransferase [Rhizomicrobium sp.]
MADSSSKRLDHIQGLRGLAAFAVVIQHGLELVERSGITIFRPLFETVNLGRFGVVLFFLISGLVIPYSFRGETPLRNFAISRFLRLYPAYWLSIPVLTGVYFLNGMPTNAATFLGNFTMIQELIGIRNIGPGYWTLKFELVFYALCLVFFAVRWLHKAALNALMAIGLLVAAVSPSILYGGNGGHESRFFFAMFFVGLLLRQALVEGDNIARRSIFVVIPTCLAAGLVMGGLFFRVPMNSGPYFHPVALAGSMTLPLIVFALTLWFRSPPSKLFMYLGTVSYSAYLFQDVGLLMLPHVISPKIWPIYLVGVVGITLLIASVVYHFVEKPMVELGHRLTKRPVQPSLVEAKAPF